MARRIDKIEKIVHHSVTITDAENTTPTDGIDLYGYSLLGITFPSTFDGTTIGFTVASSLGGTYVQMLDKNGSAYSKTCAASKYLPLDPTDFAGIQFIKPVTGTNQDTSDTILTFHLAPILN